MPKPPVFVNPALPLTQEHLKAFDKWAEEQLEEQLDRSLTVFKEQE